MYQLENPFIRAFCSRNVAKIVLNLFIWIDVYKYAYKLKGMHQGMISLFPVYRTMAENGYVRCILSK